MNNYNIYADTCIYINVYVCIYIYMYIYAVNKFSNNHAFFQKFLPQVNGNFHFYNILHIKNELCSY